jgi:hypothetical protein
VIFNAEGIAAVTPQFCVSKTNYLCRKNKNAAYPDKGISGLLI